ncbi:MAG: hypothetical protein ACM3ZV_03070 [Bacillota bacterium]
MLVYGDRQERADPASRARAINRMLDRVAAMPAGVERHALLVAALDDAGRLLQGIADAQFEDEQRDRSTAATDELGASLLAIARALCRSWDSGFESIGELPRLAPRSDWPNEVELRVPEGYAFYAVYPEAYAEAARRLKLAAPPRVVAIRSIGTSLGAIAAAALDAPPAITVRPFGDPSAREISLDPRLERELLDGEFHYVIVDEGPGQSGSSFAGVAEWLEARGVPNERIALLPSHAGGPGSMASERRRRWWAQVQREVADFGERWPALIGSWCEQLLGPLDEPPRDIAGGTWRALHYVREEDWPAAVPAFERRKYLVRARGERFLVKFASLGGIGEDKLAIARTLHAEGVVPEPLGLVHGFLVEPWCEDASPLAAADTPLNEVARYIGTRARLLPASSGSGAEAEKLLEIARRNISLEFGERAGEAVERWSGRTGELNRRIVRVRTDNRLDRQEWLRTPSRALVKTDALDHHQGHDLVGCQDVAWDVAGALTELDPDQNDARALVAAVEHWAAREVDRELLEFCRLAYCAFRLGQARLGEGMTSDCAERKRLRAAGDRYAAELQHLLESSSAATRHESSVG